MIKYEIYVKTWKLLSYSMNFNNWEMFLIFNTEQQLKKSTKYTWISLIDWIYSLINHQKLCILPKKKYYSLFLKLYNNHLKSRLSVHFTN